MVAILNGNSDSKEIRIDGDCVSAIYNTPKKYQIDRVFSDAAMINSLINILNYKFQKRKITDIKIGIGLDYGRALMIKSGFSGSGLNEVVWMGDVVNRASNLCSNANKSWEDEPLFVSDVIYNNLSDHNKNLLSLNFIRGCYHGNIINLEMESWYQENCSNQVLGLLGGW